MKGLQEFYDDVRQLLLDKTESGKINFTRDDINNFIERVACDSNGEWRFWVNPSLHNKLPTGIQKEIQAIWSNRVELNKE